MRIKRLLVLLHLNSWYHVYNQDFRRHVVFILNAGIVIITILFAFCLILNNTYARSSLVLFLFLFFSSCRS